MCFFVMERVPGFDLGKSGVDFVSDQVMPLLERESSYIYRGDLLLRLRDFFSSSSVFQIIKLMKVSLLKKRVWDSLMRKNSWGCNYQREVCRFYIRMDPLFGLCIAGEVLQIWLINCSSLRR